MRMEELPLAILSNILSNVSSQSLLRCRCVCKRWREAIDDSYFRNSLHCPKEPVLVYCGHNRKEIYLLKVQEEGPMKMIPIAIFPDMRGYVLQGACNGFLFLRHLMNPKKNPELLINPLTKEILTLPRAPELDPDESVYGFGFDCSAHTYKLVQMDAIDYDEETRTSTMRARVYDFEKRLWRACKALPPSQLPFPSLMFPSGALNWFVGWGWIVYLDLTSEEFSLIPVPDNRSKLFSQYIEIEGSPAVLRYALPVHIVQVWVLKGREWTSKYKIDMGGQYYRLLVQYERDKLIFRKSQHYRDMYLYDVNKKRFTRCGTEDIPECRKFDRCASVALSLVSLERLFGEKTSNAPRFTPSASIRRSLEILLRGDNLCTGCENTHPNTEPSFYQPQLPLQYGYVNSDGYTHQNYRYGTTSPQQEWYQGGGSSRASADPSTGSTPDQFLPNSPAPAYISWTPQNSSLHVQAQIQHGNDYCPIEMSYNFATRNNQPDPAVMSTLPRQQRGSLLRWVPLPSDGNGYMPSVQQEVYKGGSLSLANANDSGWESFQGMGITSYPSPPAPPYSPTPFNMFWTNSDSPLHAQDQYKKYLLPFINSWTGHDSAW